MKTIYPVLFSLWILFSFSCGKNEVQTRQAFPKQNGKAVQNESVKKDSTQSDSTKIVTPKVTFIELGSVNCIPCRMM